MKFLTNKRWTSVLALLASGVWLVIASAALAGSDADKPEKDEKDDFPKFDEVTKDMEVKEGFYTLYFDKKKDTLLGRIPKGSLGEPFLISFSITKGALAGRMVGGGAYYWERLDKKLVLMLADTSVAKGKGSTVEDVIARTYTDEIIAAIDIKTEAPGGDPVIDLGKLLKTDMIGLGRFYNRKLDASLSRWSTHKAFPNNVELAVDAALMGKPHEGGIIAALHLSISKLPKNGYKARHADDRIGYFMTAQKDWTVDHSEKTVFKRKIHRWKLEKQDPKAAESPVKEPIIFYIEKTVPVKFRRYVREGILMWNKSFAKCGFLDAVQVRQQTDTNEFKDIDPEDVRYNFFRWIVSGRAFAMGPSRVNPFTGQILDADIIFDDSMLRFYVHEQNLLGPRAYDALSDPIADEFYARYPDYRHQTLAEKLTPRFSQGLHLGEPSVASGSFKFLPTDGGAEPCELGVGMVQQLAFCQLASAQAGAGELPEEFIGQILAEIVAHEVGHTLGLRHNFKASAWRPLDNILSPDSKGTALTGSVMDYNPAEFAAEKDNQSDYVTRTVGPYDDWAIEYGYRPFMSGGDAKSEEDMLKSITARVAEAGLSYATDEDTSDFGPDPYVYRYDKGDDPVAYAKHRMAMVHRLRKDLADWSVEDGESYFRLRRAFNILLGEYSLAGRIAARMVGGQVVSRDHKGDPNAREPFEIVAAAKQREALTFVGDTILSDKAFQFSPELLNKLGPGRFLHRGSDQMNFTTPYSIHDRILGVQSRVLTLLLNPMTLNRIHDAELKVPADDDALTVPECVGMVMDTVWSELSNAKSGGSWTDRKPRITSIRRNVQREHLRRMISILLQEPGRGLNADSHAIVRLAIKVLGDRIDGALIKWRPKIDNYTSAHLSEARERINKALDAVFTDGASRETRRGGRRRAIVGGTESR